MRDLAKYIGLPWACPDDPPHSYDCWSLAVQVRADLGLWTPAVRVVHRIENFCAAAEAEIGRGAWVKADRPTLGDVVLLGRDHSHCGVVLEDRDVMHAFAPDGKSGAVRCDSWRLIERLFGRCEAYRLCV